MVDINRLTAKGWSRLGQRGTFFGIALPELATKDPDILVLTADLLTLSGLDRFQKEYPERIINVGIAEQNMIGISAGLAKEGYKPYATTYANFISMRSYEQIRLDCGYMQLPIKVIGSGSGLAMGMSGNTHYGIEDVSLMRSIPNMTVVCPADAVEAYMVCLASLDCPRPMYIRLTGALNTPIVYTNDFQLEIGKANILEKGSDIALVAQGTMVATSLEVSKLLRERGVSASVVDMHTIKPIDRDAISFVTKNSSNLIVTIEEHSIIGGLGSAVSEVIAEQKSNINLMRIGIEDKFLHAGDYSYLLQQCGLTPDLIFSRVVQKLEDLHANI